MTQHHDISDYPYVRCRELGHAWREAARPARVGVAEVVRVLRCAECGMGRHDLLSVRGVLVSRRYEPPQGYRIPDWPGYTRPRAADFRVEVLRRAGVLAPERRNLRAV